MKVTGTAGLVYDGVVANLLNNIQQLVALMADQVPGDRGVYRQNVIVVQNNNDYEVANALQDTKVTALYWWGHGANDGNAFSASLTAQSVSQLLGNKYVPAHNVSGLPPFRARFESRLPFSFVFLDGCRTALGNLPEAFGIPKAIPARAYTQNNKHKRAFMGWNGRVTASLLDNNSLNWSLRFWQKWLDGSGMTTLQDAINSANSQSTPSGGIVVYGDPSLRWSD